MQKHSVLNRCQCTLNFIGGCCFLLSLAIAVIGVFILPFFRVNSFELKTDTGEVLLAVSDCGQVTLDGNTVRYRKDGNVSIYSVPNEEEITLENTCTCCIPGWTENVNKCAYGIFVFSLILSVISGFISVQIDNYIDRQEEREEQCN